MREQMSQHAFERIGSRNISVQAVAAVLEYGREVYNRGARIFAIGRREIDKLREFGIDLSRHDGVQVICSALGEVITVYRNRDLRGLRRQRRVWPRRTGGFRVLRHGRGALAS